MIVVSVGRLHLNGVLCLLSLQQTSTGLNTHAGIQTKISINMHVWEGEVGQCKHFWLREKNVCLWLEAHNPAELMPTLHGELFVFGEYT
jgi:hypothetical protein